MEVGQQKLRFGINAWVILLAIVIVLGYLSTYLIADVFFKQGVQLYNQSQYDNAKTKFQQASKFNKRDPRVYAYLGEISLGIPRPGNKVFYPDADYISAIDAFEKARYYNLQKKDQKLYTIILNDLGFSYWQYGNKMASHTIFLEYITLKPSQSFTARYLVGLDYYYELNKPKEALELLQPLPDQAILNHHRAELYNVYLLLANLSWYFNDLENAKRYALLSIANAPQNQNADEVITLANMRLAFIAASEDGIKEALKYYSRALESAKRVTVYSEKQSGNCSLAGLYFHAKQYTRAIGIASAEAKTNRTDYYYSNCLEVLALGNQELNREAESKRYMEEYLKFTETLESPDILILKQREEFIKKL